MIKLKYLLGIIAVVMSSCIGSTQTYYEEFIIRNKCIDINDRYQDWIDSNIDSIALILNALESASADNFDSLDPKFYCDVMRFIKDYYRSIDAISLEELTSTLNKHKIGSFGYIMYEEVNNVDNNSNNNIKVRIHNDKSDINVFFDSIRQQLNEFRLENYSTWNLECEDIKFNYIKQFNDLATGNYLVETIEANNHYSHLNDTCLNLIIDEFLLPTNYNQYENYSLLIVKSNPSLIELAPIYTVVTMLTFTKGVLNEIVQCSPNPLVPPEITTFD